MLKQQKRRRWRFIAKVAVQSRRGHEVHLVLEAVQLVLVRQQASRETRHVGSEICHIGEYGGLDWVNNHGPEDRYEIVQPVDEGR